MCTCTCWGKGGVPSGRFQEQDFSLFVISFLRKHTHLQFYSVFSYWADKTQRRSAAWWRNHTGGHWGLYWNVKLIYATVPSLVWNETRSVGTAKWLAESDLRRYLHALKHLLHVCMCHAYGNKSLITLVSVNKELRCSDLVWSKPSSFLMSHRFATKWYLHGASNLFSRFLLPMTSHGGCMPPCVPQIHYMFNMQINIYHIVPSKRPCK